MPYLRRFAAFACLLGLVAALSPRPAAADDWPYFRGPNHNGISTEKGWNPAAAKQIWNKQLGDGCSSVAVVGDRVYSAGHRGGRDIVYCLDANTGDEIWTYEYPADRWAKMHDGGPGSTPTVADGRVFIVSRDGGMYCINADNGKLIYHKDLAREYGVRPPKWGFTASVLPYEGNIYIDMGRILALQPATGEEIWATKNYGEAYSTPAPFDLGRIPALAVFPEAGLVILRRDTGKHGGQFDWETSYGVHAATPIVGDGPGDSKVVFIGSGYNVGGALLNLGGGRINKVWETREMRNHMSTAVLYQNHIYGFDEGQLKCLAVDNGDRRWSERGLGKGALSMADGKLIVVGERGELVIAEASPQGFNPIFNQRAVSGTCWVMPVLANGKIFVKSNTGHLACFNVAR